MTKSTIFFSLGNAEGEMGTKTCIKCREQKPQTTDFFSKDKSREDGFCVWCKECKREHERNYRQTKKEVHQKRDRKYYENNKERRSESNRKYRNENKLYFSEYRKMHKEKSPDYMRQIKQLSMARKIGANHTYTIEEWEKAKQYFNYSCAYCGMTEEEHLERYGEILHQDHFIPVSNGGEYVVNNIIPACRSCNAKKHDADFESWYQASEHFNEVRKRRILIYINEKS